MECVIGPRQNSDIHFWGWEISMEPTRIAQTVSESAYAVVGELLGLG